MSSPAAAQSASGLTNVSSQTEEDAADGGEYDYDDDEADYYVGGAYMFDGDEGEYDDNDNAGADSSFDVGGVTRSEGVTAASGAGNSGANNSGAGNTGAGAESTDGDSYDALSGAITDGPSFRQPVPAVFAENDVSVHPAPSAKGLFDAGDLPEFDADAYILIERRTGQTIFSKNADMRLYPASTTKIMTGILAIEMGDMDELMTASVRAVRDVGADGSNIGIIAGERMRLDNLLDALIVRSANEAANIIAENISETREEFIALMNDKARELGAYDTQFVNASGYHDAAHYSTAYDLALIANYAMNNARFREIAAKRNIILSPTNKHSSWERLITTNSLLTDNSVRKFSVTGIKTGYHSASGYCLVASGIDHNTGMELLCVVLGVHGGAGSSAKRFKIGADLLSFGFERFQMNTFVRDNEVVGTVSVLGGEGLDTVDAASDGTVRLFMPMDQQNWQISRIEYIKSEITAPVASGDSIGYVEFRNAGKYAGRVNLTAASDIAALRGAARNTPNRGDTGSARSALSLAAGAGEFRFFGASAGRPPPFAPDPDDTNNNAGVIGAGIAGIGRAADGADGAFSGGIDFMGVFKAFLFAVFCFLVLLYVLRTINKIRRSVSRSRRIKYYGRLDYPGYRDGNLPRGSGYIQSPPRGSGYAQSPPRGSGYAQSPPRGPRRAPARPPDRSPGRRASEQRAPERRSPAPRLGPQRQGAQSYYNYY